MIEKFIKLKNRRFKLEDISHYDCRGSSNYTGNPPLIVIFKKYVKDGYEVVYKTNGKADKEEYLEDMNRLDEIFLGKTSAEAKILP